LNEPLPIDALLPEIVQALHNSNGLVITSPPGTGKTTRVPRALYRAGFAEAGEILILEPRRIAARLAAARVAEELGEKLGLTVGFTIRWETVDSLNTSIRFVTEAILARKIIRDPLLSDAAVVILDEFHERHLQTDIGLAFLRQLQISRRPELKIVVMSATLDAQPVADFLGCAPILKHQETLFETSIEYETRQCGQPLHEKVLRATARLVRGGLIGDILVFLPGAAEIRQAGEALAPLATSFEMLIAPLHGDLPSGDQLSAVVPQQRRKIILATNVAETSITIPGIEAVIDSGLARHAGHSPWSGLPTTSIKKVSKASATQRAGRAGRTREGQVLRLYTRADFESRPEHEIPEILRADLAETVLTLHGAGVEDIRKFAWFEAPPEAALSAAEKLLEQLGALNPAGRITSTGNRMLRYPLHPRLARMIAEGERLATAAECCLLAALVSERDIRLEGRSRLRGARRQSITRSTGTSDLIELLDRFREAESCQFESRRLLQAGLDPRAVERVERARRQLVRLTTKNKVRPAKTDIEEALRIAILTAFPDRVARRRKPGAPELVLSGGGEALLSNSSVVHGAALLVAADTEQRISDFAGRGSAIVLVRLASAIEPEWLAALYPDSISEAALLQWHESAGRVDEVKRTYYGQLVLEETSRPAPPSAEVSRLLADAVSAQGLSVFPDADLIPMLQARLALLAETFPDGKILALSEEEVRTCVEALCTHKRSLSELKHESLIGSIVGRLPPRQRELLERQTPERIFLRTGRRVRVNYQIGKPPWIESRLQDFFGMTTTPKICAGRVALTIHLLAPNGRALQVTQDLAGFWHNHYPAIRRELQRRYPKHAWPEHVKT
jgi:ATP-dependent helicase HrpB